MMLGADGMLDLQARAEGLSADARSRRWKPGRSDRKALAILNRANGAVVPREAITEMLDEMGARGVNRMDARLITLLVDSAAAQDLPSVAALPETQQALSAVAALVHAVARHQDPDTRRAAWDLYVALHNLAESQTWGEVATSDQGQILGDIDDALAQLKRTEAVLTRSHPELVQQVRQAVASWPSEPATRLVEFLSLLDALGDIAGASLPLQMPPTT
ncbi:hypothetical protein ACIHIX_18505 [Streptomyces sp. NPDC051913]|uniref:hypothetical protein n=1 Tax=Streptomyces sp. NPDC051913 TaxID=3365676 RepID=UPI0037CFA815